MSAALPGQARQPDIVLIITDQQTASAMSCAGNPYVKTPAMDALAKDGMMFRRAYVAYPLSGPSRASLFTGKMPWELGIRDNDDTPSVEEMRQSLGVRMQAAGYDCLYAGKWHVPEVNIPDTGTGFRKVCNMDDRRLVDACIPHLRERREKPLFLIASFLNPHEICEYARGESLPFTRLPAAAVEDCPMLPCNFPEPAYFPEALTLHKAAVPKSYPTAMYSDNDWRRYLHAYYRLVETVDAEIGRLTAALKACGRYDGSLILFMSDHGDGAAAHRWNQKRALLEEVMRVPFIVKLPKGGMANRVNEQALVNVSIDVYPTVCDYAGASATPGLRGKSLRGVLEGTSTAHHEYVFTETLLDGIGVRAWSVVNHSHKYVLYNYFRNREQLFDLQADPLEMRNLAPDPAQAEILNGLRKTLYRWGIAINDPRLIRQLAHHQIIKSSVQ
jgi:arylsulfatase A-like enzyme